MKIKGILFICLKNGLICWSLNKFNNLMFYVYYLFMDLIQLIFAFF